MKQGRPLKFNEKTQVLSFRAPCSKAKKLSRIVKNYLKTLAK